MMLKHLKHLKNLKNKHKQGRKVLILKDFE